MKNLFANLFSRPAAAPAPAVLDREEMLSAQREIQSLKMDLEQRDKQIRILEGEIDRMRAGQQKLIEETVAARMEALFTDLAGPGSQILTQADLLENQARSLEARDVLAIARRMVRALERHGVTFEGKIGDPVGFDPNRHTPLNAAVQLRPGQPSVVRFVGARYKDKIIYKAVVE